MRFIPKAPVLLLAPVMLGACVVIPIPVPGAAPGPVPESPTAGACNADGGSAFIGQPVNETLGARVLAATGARSLRWGPPGGAMTMDFRDDRVNVFYNAEMIVERITCG
jgi:hypothetical protein